MLKEAPKKMDQSVLGKIIPWAEKSGLNIWQITEASGVGMKDLENAGIARRWRRGEPKKAVK